MLYSSGTTGRPKGVKAPVPDVPLGTDPPLLTLCTMLFGFSEGMVYLSPAPLYHSAPLRFNKPAGAAAVHGRVGPEEFKS